jgi:predicted dehydrogenase
MSKLRVIQCGVGGFGKGWVTGAASRSADVELVGIVDVSQKALTEAGEAIKLSPERWYPTLEAALDDVEADAVLTVTPPAVHVEHARLAFGRGLHLMTEKPLAADMRQAREMVELARKAGRQLVVSQNYRYSPPMQTLRRLAREAKPVGELGHGHVDFYIPADFTGSFRETMAHVLLVDMCIHHMDLIRAVTGRNITKVFAHTFKPAWSWYQHNPGLKMVLELEGGIPFSYSGDWSGKGRNTSWNGDWRLQCAEGSLHLDSRNPDRVSIARSSRGFSPDTTEQTVTFDKVELQAQHATLKHFVDAIRTGKPAEISGEDNLWSFGAVMAGVKSAETGLAIDVREFIGL